MDYIIIIWLIMLTNAFHSPMSSRRYFGCVVDIQSRWMVGKSLKKMKALPWAMRQQSGVGLGLLYPPAGPEPASNTLLPLAEMFVFIDSGISY